MHSTRSTPRTANGAETRRLAADARREQNWKRWGPYLAERQWGTVREDYSADGESWDYFSHEDAIARAYRWGEDGLLGITDRQGRLCFAVALWNERDTILKERLFGLTGPEGNHGEDVKEMYFYLDSTPTHSYMKALYKYPQAAFPYQRLRDENRRRGKAEPEFELADSGVFDGNRYFDVLVEYAKASPNDLLIRIRATNRGPDVAPLHVLPTLWYRNTWSTGRSGEDYWPKPRLYREALSLVRAEHASLGHFCLAIDADSKGGGHRLLFTENETNRQRVFGEKNVYPWVKDAFHEAVIHNRSEGLHPGGSGTKCAAHFRSDLEPEETLELRLRLCLEAEVDGVVAEFPTRAFGDSFDGLMAERIDEANAFYAERIPPDLSPEEESVMRQGYAGLLWSKQFYFYSVKDWIEGDPTHPPPPSERRNGRNSDWRHLYNRDIISMPDKWEYPWYAAWDLAFHMVPFARIDPAFAKDQLLLFLREWYMHPNGQIPAYEFGFSDVNPPVHAWAVWRTYKIAAQAGRRDRAFLARAFQKLLLNFTWWINRKDLDGNHIFSGGFLGLDNIGVFDRSRPSPLGGHLQQADATAWMAFFCATMLSIALELAREDPVYEDVASKFFEHFVAIADAINSFDGEGLWEDKDGFYYDHLRHDDEQVPLRVRSMVGLLPLITVEILDGAVIDQLPGFRKRMQWFLTHRQDLAKQITCMEPHGEDRKLLLAIPSRERLLRLLRYLLDENEFLSPFGIRSLSRVHADNPFVLHSDGKEYRVGYVPGESDSYLFGGNSNWRGPIWFPVNYLIVEALERYHRFYGDALTVECPTGSGRYCNLREVAAEIDTRLRDLFLSRDGAGRPAHGGDPRFRDDPHWRELLLFYEYFDGDNGRGLGASHQTGWTALVLRCIEKLHARSK